MNCMFFFDDCDCLVFVNDFGNFFVRKIRKIRLDFDLVNLDLNEN